MTLSFLPSSSSLARAVLVLAVCGSWVSQAWAAQGPLPAPSWYVPTEGPATFGDWPTDGVILIAALYDRGAAGSTITADQALAFVTVQVTDPSGAVLPGELRYELPHGPVVWQGESAFEPMSTYGVTVVVDNEGLHQQWGGSTPGHPPVERLLTFTTGTLPAVSAPGFVLNEERATANRLNGCADCPDGQVCLWDPVVSTTYTLEVEPEREWFYRVDVAADDSSASCLSTPSLHTVRCAWSQTQSQYCYDVTVTSLFDGSMSASEQRCVAAEQFSVPAEAEPSCSEGDGGCTIAAVTPGSPARSPLGWLVAAIVLVVGLRLRPAATPTSSRRRAVARRCQDGRRGGDLR